MGVAEEEQVQVFLLRRQPRPHQGLFDAVGVPVAHQDPHVPQEQKPLRGLGAAEITVAGDLLQGQLRQTVMETLTVPPAVPQVQNQPGRLPLRRLEHIGDVSMGIGQDQNLHYSTLPPPPAAPEEKYLSRHRRKAACGLFRLFYENQYRPTRPAFQWRSGQIYTFFKNAPNLLSKDPPPRALQVSPPGGAAGVSAGASASRSQKIFEKRNISS